MKPQTLEADYLIIGCGAIGMAFADVILSECDASIVMVDRHAAPGGHWNDAYPFVRLHQASRAMASIPGNLGMAKKPWSGSTRGSMSWPQATKF